MKRRTLIGLHESLGAPASLGGSCEGRDLAGRDAGAPRRVSLLACAALLAAFVPTAASANTVVNSKHNLSVTGPGTVKAKTQTDVCIFCHAAHKTTGQTPLWSHAMSAVTNY